MEYSQIIASYIESTGVSAYKLSKATGISESTFSKWKSNPTSNISLSNIKKIAEYFNVSTDYLLGNEPKNRLPAEAKSLSDIENEILEIYNTLPKDKKQAFLTVARSLKSQSADK
jgi:transcriptional regulator with XRE-family HTH domain